MSYTSDTMRRRFLDPYLKYIILNVLIIFRWPILFPYAQPMCILNS